MTLRELQSEICTLGFDRCAELNLGLIYAARRSIAEISRSARQIRRITLSADRVKSASHIEEPRSEGGRTQLLPLNEASCSRYASIDMKDLTTDFIAFSSDITDGCGKPIRGALIFDGMILLPPDYDGEVSVAYYRSLSVPSLSTPDAPIDIPDEYETLLPLLTASYMLLDTDPEKAAFYRDAYFKASEELRGFGYSSTLNGYRDVNGWA